MTSTALKMTAALVAAVALSSTASAGGSQFPLVPAARTTGPRAEEAAPGRSPWAPAPKDPSCVQALLTQVKLGAIGTKLQAQVDAQCPVLRPLMGLLYIDGVARASGHLSSQGQLDLSVDAPLGARRACLRVDVVLEDLPAGDDADIHAERCIDLEVRRADVVLRRQ